MYLKGCVLFTAILFSVVSCGHSPTPKRASPFGITAEQREWMDPFFKELMLEHSAIYTLWGSKPITNCTLYYYTDEEIQEWYDNMTEEERKTAIVRINPYFEDKWEKWEKIQNQFPMTRYLLFKTKNPTCEKSAFVYFVNILETAHVLRQHYALFKEAVGADFDPFEMACDFKNIDSPFWEKARGNAALYGILFGFGERNSWFFQWKYFTKNLKNMPVADAISFKASDEPRCGKYSITDFSLPIFMIFSERTDEMVETYKKEREEIKNIYKRQDFLELTLKKLTS